MGLFVPLFEQGSMKQKGKHWVERGPRDGIRTRVTISAVALFAAALTRVLEL